MTEPVSVYRDVLEETHEFYRENHEGLGNHGYLIMYGPIRTRPPVLFLGYQPGGDQTTGQHLCPKPDQKPPTVSYYATERWKLASNMRAMWPQELLARSTGLNAVFFRSPSVGNFSAIERRIRRQAINFSTPRAEKLIEAIDPIMIVSIGFATLRLFGNTRVVLANERGRTLVREGIIAGRAALGTLHLSGARISAADRQAIADLIARSWSGSCG